MTEVNTCQHGDRASGNAELEFGGAWVDRMPKRPVMPVCNGVSMVVFASVPIATTSALNYGAIPLGGLLGGMLGDAVGVRETLGLMAVIQFLSLAVLLLSPFGPLRDFPAPTPPRLEAAVQSLTTAAGHRATPAAASVAAPAAIRTIAGILTRFRRSSQLAGASASASSSASDWSALSAAWTNAEPQSFPCQVTGSRPVRRPEPIMSKATNAIALTDTWSPRCMELIARNHLIQVHDRTWERAHKHAAREHPSTSASSARRHRLLTNWAGINAFVHRMYTTMRRPIFYGDAAIYKGKVIRSPEYVPFDVRRRAEWF
ncbi:hypothetical protein [Microbispora sp. NPDC046933]|uniref:hypothetical protein n=1 Tax=Microbispora sp. NPDC046933 TaxID=3155618 RepID=UPI0033D87D56